MSSPRRKRAKRRTTMFSLMRAIFSWTSWPTVSLGSFEGLLEQAEGGVVLLELALGDLLDHRRRLALGDGLGLVDLFLLLEGHGRHLLLGHVEGQRRGGGRNVH